MKKVKMETVTINKDYVTLLQRVTIEVTQGRGNEVNPVTKDTWNDTLQKMVNGIERQLK